jgi:hypothetical protein
MRLLGGRWTGVSGGQARELELTFPQDWVYNADNKAETGNFTAAGTVSYRQGSVPVSAKSGILRDALFVARVILSVRQ